MTLLLPLLLGLASATEPAPRTAVLISPLGVGASVVGHALGTPTYDVPLRLSHAASDRVGLTLQTDLTWSTPFDMATSYTGLRGGPRISLRGRGLDDWTLTPFALAGVSTVSAGGERLARYGMVGVGVEAGRTWVWKHFTMEVGLGAYAATDVAYAARAEVFADLRVQPVLPIKPTVNWSVGYAF